MACRRSGLRIPLAIANLKELRPGSRGRSEVRILFVFDPWRSAILLVAGDKAGSWNKWYARMIPRAEQLCEIYLEERAAEGRQPVTSYTKWELAETMGVTPGRVSQIERGELSTIEAIARYVQALGGRLDLVANFADHTLTVTTTDAA
jgi:hypothetical protein